MPCPAAVPPSALSEPNPSSRLLTPPPSHSILRRNLLSAFGRTFRLDFSREETLSRFSPARPHSLHRHLFLRLALGPHLSHRLWPAFQLFLAYLLALSHPGLHVGRIPPRRSSCETPDR